MEITIKIPDWQDELLFEITKCISCGGDPFAKRFVDGKYQPMEEKEEMERLHALKNLHIAVYVAIKRKVARTRQEVWERNKKKGGDRNV